MLAHDEVVRMDPMAVDALHAQMGEAAAEGVIGRAMEELANRLSLIERCYYQRETDALRTSTEGLIGMCEQIGLPLLAQVAGDVCHCIDGGDDPALAATVARLVRLGDRSLTVVWDIPGMTI